jgi:hypothetical protein
MRTHLSGANPINHDFTDSAPLIRDDLAQHYDLISLGVPPPGGFEAYLRRQGISVTITSPAPEASAEPK